MFCYRGETLLGFLFSHCFRCCAFIFEIAWVCWIYSERYQHCTCKLPVSNCVSQWPITSITGYLHNAFPITHADVITACTNGVSDCRCKSVDVITCTGTTKPNSVWTAIAPVTMVLLYKTRELKSLFWPRRILSPADWNCIFLKRNKLSLQQQGLLWFTPLFTGSCLYAGRWEHLDVFM